MTATSPKGGRVLFPSSYQQADDPLDSAFLRNIVANNALHAADESARVLVNWVAPKSGGISGNPPLHLTLDTLAASNTWYMVDAYGPFPLSAYETGAPYKLRFAVLAQAGSGTATFGITIVPRGAAVAALDGGTGVSGEDAATFVGTVAGSPTWLAPSSGSDILSVSDAMLATSLTTRGTVDDTGGALVEVAVPEIEISIWVKQSSIGTSARLYGVHVAEFVG